ncbi:cell cycle control protein [Colletotrichum tofieldiae]|uniref:Cell cycle control protein n=1 Tax=Colletotrichum tofieldiae TaxID=708197 RepID=A0A166U3F4_9PEZI|nr:cell cycle control protein [Colletotrichum tofieldiae]
MDTSRDSSNLLDTHNRLIADVLSRFRMLTMLATIQAEGERKNAEPQTVAVTGMSMQMEFEGLHTSIKDLLALSRRLKELWLFGKLGRGEGDARIQADKLQADVVRCAELLNAIQETRYAGLASAAGGKWALMGRPDTTPVEGAAAAAPPPANPVAPNSNGNGAGAA